MQVTDELRVLVEAEVARAVENFRKLGESVGDAEGETKSLGDAIDAISKKALVVSASIVGAGVAAIKFAGENEKLKTSLKNMLGDAEEASSVFEEWRRLGASPGLSAGEVFSLGKAMVGMGHDTEYATRTMQMLGDVAAGTGGSFGAVSGSFERVRAQGRLTARDLAGLQQQGIPVLRQMARELGTSEEGIRRMAAEGRLGFSDLEKAFRGMTGPGGQFAGMMDEMSNTTMEKFSSAMGDAKQALASFGELMLPMATGLLDGASSALRGIGDMDEGTKRFAIGMGGVVAISGPAIAAIRGIGAAMATLAANPYMLAIGGAIAGAAALAGVINKQANAYENLQNEIKKTGAAAKDLLVNYSAGNDEKILDEKTTRELIKLYPELSGVINKNNTTVKEALDLARQQSEQKTIDSQSARIKKLLDYQAALRDTVRLTGETYDAMKAAEAAGYTPLRHIQQREMDRLIAERHKLSEDIRAQQEVINQALAGIGKQYSLSKGIIAIPVTLTVDPKSIEPSPIPAAAKKRWQEWYGEIAGIDPALITGKGGKSAGTVAAELFLSDFSRSLGAGKTVSAALGEEFDVAGALRGQQADIQKALAGLFSINPADIDSGFTAIDTSIAPLIEQYRRLGAEAKAAEDAMKAAAGQKAAADAIEGLRQKIADLGKSEGQLARDLAVANGALPEQAEEIGRLTDELGRKETLEEYNRQIREIGKSQGELAIAAYAAKGATEAEMAAFRATLNLRDELLQAEKLKETLDGVKDSLLNIAAGATLNGIKSLGEALGQGRRGVDEERACRDEPGDTQRTPHDVPPGGAAAHLPGAVGTGAGLRRGGGVCCPHRRLRRREDRAGDRCAGKRPGQRFLRGRNAGLRPRRRVHQPGRGPADTVQVRRDPRQAGENGRGGPGGDSAAGAHGQRQPRRADCGGGGESHGQRHKLRQRRSAQRGAHRRRGEHPA